MEGFDFEFDLEKLKPGDCCRCGKCCESIVFRCWHGGQEWEDWYIEHGCTFMYDPKDQKRKIGLIVPSVCQHLAVMEEVRGDKETGFHNFRKYTTCLIYDHRPLYCRSKIDERMFLKPEGCTQ